MRIAVCVKQVPETSDLQVDPQTHTLIREGVEAVFNPLDEFPLEVALHLREMAGGGEVCVFTMGPPQAKTVLETSIAMGADNGFLLTDRAFAGSDTWATSLVLARAIEQYGPFDLILCGKQAVDGDTAQVGPEIASHMGSNQVTYVTDVFDISDQVGNLRVKRMLEAGEVEIEVATPVVLTILKNAHEPRLPSLSGRIRSLKTSMTAIGASDLGLAYSEVGLDGSPTRVVNIRVPESNRGKVVYKGVQQEALDKVAEWVEAVID